MANYTVFIVFLILVIILVIIGYCLSCKNNSCNTPHSNLKTPRTPRTPRTPKGIDFEDSKGNIIKAIINNKSGQKISAQVGSTLFGVDVILPNIYTLDINEQMVVDSSTSTGNLKLGIINSLIGKTGVYKIANTDADLDKAKHNYVNNFPGADLKIPEHDFTIQIEINANLVIENINII